MDKNMAGPHRAGDAMEHVHERLNGHDEAILKLFAGQQALTLTMEKLVINVGRVAEVLEAFNNAKGFWLTFKFLSAFAKAMLPIFIFFASIGALWIFLKSGQWINPK